MRKLLMIELNEVNFDFVQRYGERGELPRLNALIAAHGLIETISEQRYEQLEPWIQWVSAHTGLSLADHGVTRLGDIVDRPELKQIWELVEAAGYKVGAVSPMNARNDCANPGFFVPDPWTRTKVTGPGLMHRLYDAVAQIVNDNAQERVKPSSLAWLGAGLARYARPANYPLYAGLIASAPKKSWSRAMLLDLLLTDIFVTMTRRHDVDFASLFLNAAAHIQHHYMFNASVYSGPHANPDWYVRADADPLLDIYRLYDTLVGRIVDAFPQHRLMVATGLHQDPYPELLFYWRLRDHAAFLTEMEVPFARVEPRMSRDFVVFCDSTSQAAEAERIMAAAEASDGQKLFEIDNRGDSLFVMLVYPGDIKGLGYRVGNRQFEDLAGKTAFVAIKNGEHNGIGYLIDTDETAGVAKPQIPVTDLFERVRDNFGLRDIAALRAA
ncbi:MAG: hypothetical protein V4574_01200 [Pseudomonadota bacterium]